MVLNGPQQEIRERVMNSAVIQEADGLSTLTFLAMGTRCRVSLVEPTRQSANDYLQALLHQVADFEAKYSRFIDQSLISAINRAAGREWCEIDPEAEHIFRLCDQFHFLSRGAFDPTALPLIRLWNWKAPKPVVPTQETVTLALAKVGWKKVLRKANSVMLPEEGMCLDLGGIGKEYAVDAAIQLADQHGIPDVLIDFGQDLRVKGKPPGRPAWHVGLEDPERPGSCWASVAGLNTAIATSGSYLRQFTFQGRSYGHIIDPRTGHPTDAGCLAVSVLAPSCVLAGILTTTACILGPEEGYHLIHGTYGAAGAIVTSRQKLFTPRMYEYLVNK